ncbi:hypothetical protein Tco_0835549, partial [Tanacetum coccineum]
ALGEASRPSCLAFQSFNPGQSFLQSFELQLWPFDQIVYSRIAKLSFLDVTACASFVSINGYVYSTLITHVKTTTLEAAHAMPWATLKKMTTDKYCPRGEIKKIDDCDMMRAPGNGVSWFGNAGANPEITSLRLHQSLPSDLSCVGKLRRLHAFASASYDVGFGAVVGCQVREKKCKCVYEQAGIRKQWSLTSSLASNFVMMCIIRGKYVEIKELFVPLGRKSPKGSSGKEVSRCSLRRLRRGRGHGASAILELLGQYPTR